MGIDIYLEWKGMTKAEKQAQYTGFSIIAGKVGYLREAYHGEPYATRFFVEEAFNDRGRAKIKASVLKERLPEALKLVAERERTIYNASAKEIKEAQKSYVDFAKLAAEKEIETGQPCTVVASY